MSRFIVKTYGDITEITEVQKDTKKVRVFSSRKRRSVYGWRRPDNTRRTKQICVRRVLSALKEYGRPLLATLTFSGDSSDASYANDSLRVFQVRLRNEFSNAQSLFIPELSPRGRIHFHGLIFNVPLHLGDTRQGRRVISYGTERESRILAKLWGEGFVDATQTDGSGKLAHYISKYINKGGGEVMFNAMRILRISHGFPKEIVYKGVLAKKIARHYYKNKKSVKDYEVDNIFLGKIKKKLYNNES